MFIAPPFYTKTCGVKSHVWLGERREECLMKEHIQWIRTGLLCPGILFSEDKRLQDCKKVHVHTTVWVYFFLSFVLRVGRNTAPVNDHITLKEHFMCYVYLWLSRWSFKLFIFFHTSDYYPVMWEQIFLVSIPRHPIIITSNKNGQIIDIKALKLNHTKTNNNNNTNYWSSLSEHGKSML